MAPVIFIEQSKDSGIAISVENGQKMVTVTTDIGDFTIEDVVVKPVNEKLVIHAKRDVTCGGEKTFREFNKEYTLPESVDPFTVDAELADGKLIVRAPLTC